MSVIIVKQRFVPVMDDWTVKANVSAHQDIPEQIVKQWHVVDTGI